MVTPEIGAKIASVIVTCAAIEPLYALPCAGLVMVIVGPESARNPRTAVPVAPLSVVAVRCSS